MRHLDARVSAWRRELAATESIGAETLRELESHLLDAIDEELEGGADLDSAFATAVAQVGRPEELGREYGKVHPDVSWAKRFVWMLSGFALISIAQLFIDLTRSSTEILFANGYPTSVLPIPNSDGHIHISVIASILAMAVAACLCLWVGARVVRGRSGIFDRYFAAPTAGRSLIVLLVAFSLLVAATSSHSTFFWLSHLIAAADHVKESLPSSVNIFPGQLVRMWAANLIPLLMISFSAWAVFRVRSQPRRSFIAWMLGGYFSFHLIGFLATYAGTLLGLGVLWAKGESLVAMSKEGYGFVALFSVIAQAVIGLVIAFIGTRVACGRPSSRTENLVRWCWRRAPFLIALWAIAIVAKQLISHVHFVGEGPILAEGWALEVLLLYTRSNAYLLIRFGLLFALAAIWLLFREQRFRNHPGRFVPA